MFFIIFWDYHKISLKAGSSHEPSAVGNRLGALFAEGLQFIKFGVAIEIVKKFSRLRIVFACVVFCCGL